MGEPKTDLAVEKKGKDTPYVLTNRKRHMGWVVKKSKILYTYDSVFGSPLSHFPFVTKSTLYFLQYSEDITVIHFHWIPDHTNNKFHQQVDSLAIRSLQQHTTFHQLLRHNTDAMASGGVKNP